MKHIWERPCDDSWVYKEEYLTSASAWHCNDLCLPECPMRFLIRRAVRCTPLATLLYWYVAAGGPSCKWAKLVEHTCGSCRRDFFSKIRISSISPTLFGSRKLENGMTPRWGCLTWSFSIEPWQVEVLKGRSLMLVIQNWGYRLP